MNAPICRACSGKGKRYVDGSTVKVRCPDCEGTGERAPKQIQPITKKKQAKMRQVADFKMDYAVACIASLGLGYYEEGVPVAPCQTCREYYVPINKAQFSHKDAAKMGGSGDVGGEVQGTNGTYSCAACNSFLEEDRQAYREHRDSPANILNLQPVEFSSAVAERHEAYLKKWGRR